MLDPFLTQIAAALAQRVGEGVADAAQSAWSSLVRLVRTKLGSSRADMAALEAAREAPGDEQRQWELALALQRAALDDPQFGGQLRTLWQQAAVDIHAEGGGVASQFSGSGGVVFQAARDLTITAAAPAAVVVPRQVPASSATFVNRVEELAAMDRALVGAGTGGSRLGVLVGMPGVGKTALARRWVDAAPDRFPGGELYVDYAALRSETGTGAATSEAVASCLRGLGVDERFLPSGLAELTSLYRTRTAERAVLVVLDGVHAFGIARRQKRNHRQHRQSGQSGIEEFALHRAQRHHPKQSNAQQARPCLGADGNHQAGECQR